MDAARQTIARLRTLFLWLALGAIPVDLVLRAAGGVTLPLPVVLGALFGGVVLSSIPPPPSGLTPVTVASPVRGRWVPINGPGSRVPSHGTRGTGQTFAVDVVRPTTTDTPAMPRTGLVPDRPERYPTFGADVHAVAGGTVLRTVDRRRDHRARNTWPALAYMMSLEGLARSLGGWSAIAGNHVAIRHDDGLVALYAHLRRGSIRVRPGQAVATGEVLGAVGNSGNSSEPHLHVQLMEQGSVGASSGVPMVWDDLTWGEETDPRWTALVKSPDDTAIVGFPPNATVFEVPTRPASDRT